MFIICIMVHLCSRICDDTVLDGLQVFHLVQIELFGLILFQSRSVTVKEQSSVWPHASLTIWAGNCSWSTWVAVTIGILEFSVLTWWCLTSSSGSVWLLELWTGLTKSCCWTSHLQEWVAALINNLLATSSKGHHIVSWWACALISTKSLLSEACLCNWCSLLVLTISVDQCLSSWARITTEWLTSSTSIDKSLSCWASAITIPVLHLSRSALLSELATISIGDLCIPCLACTLTIGVCLSWETVILRSTVWRISNSSRSSWTCALSIGTFNLGSLACGCLVLTYSIHNCLTCWALSWLTSSSSVDHLLSWWACTLTVVVKNLCW